MLGQYGAYESFLRADAQTHFLVVTDDNSNLLGATFKTQMEQKLGHGFVFHSVVADGLNGCLGASTGTEYLSLSDTTGGAKQAICGTNWDQLSTQLNAAASGTSSATCAFTLPSPPGGQPLDPLTVNLRFRPPSAAETDLPKATNSGACGSAQAWFFDQTLSPTQIELCPAACSAVKAGGTLRVAYGCASVEL
jgi:hypothetical protein